MVWQPHYGMDLSQSEREIMEMFCDGMTSGEIARERRTTENTVRAQLDDELFIREVPDWTAGLRRTETPFLTTLGYKHVKVGEQDEFGRTLLGYTEIDETEKQRLTLLSAAYREKLYETYKNGKFELVEHTGEEYGQEYSEERWEPVETEETRHLENMANQYAVEAREMYPRPIWDRELTEEEKRPKKLTWGWARPALPLADIEPK